MKEFGKNLMIRKKGIPLDEKETFCNIIDLLEETILRSEKVYDEVNIDMIAGPSEIGKPQSSLGCFISKRWFYACGRTLFL